MSVHTLARALDQNADSVVVTNRDGVIEYVNPSFERMTGFSREQAIGQTPRLIRSGIATPQFYETLWSTILSGRAFHMTITNRRNDGRLFDQEETITPIRDASGAITHFVATGRDVTDRQQSASSRLRRQLIAEGARVASRLHDEAGQFFALAHITLAGLAGRLAPPDAARVQEVRGYLEYVEERLREAARGAHPRTSGGGALVDAIRFLVTECERRTGAQVVLQASLDRPCPPSIESLLYRFVQEALLNVISHGEAPCLTIELDRHLGGRRAADSTICCTIWDDGRGFDAASLALGITQDDGGLRLMEERLKAVGGTLVVTSVPGQRTQFCAKVPVEEVSLST